MRWESRCACCPLVSFVLSSTVNILSYLILPFLSSPGDCSELGLERSRLRLERRSRQAATLLPSTFHSLFLAHTHTHTRIYICRSFLEWSSLSR